MKKATKILECLFWIIFIILFVNSSYIMQNNNTSAMVLMLFIIISYPFLIFSSIKRCCVNSKKYIFIIGILYYLFIFVFSIINLINKSYINYLNDMKLYVIPMFFISAWQTYILEKDTKE